MRDLQNIWQQQTTYFESGATRPLRARRQALRALKSALDSFTPRILEASASDLGRSEIEARATEVSLPKEEALLALRRLWWWARPKWRLSVLVNQPASATTRWVPLGRNLILSPWNYPFLLTLSPLISSIAAGNVSIIKPSELSPASSEVLAELVRQSLDPQLATVVQGGVDVSQALLERPFDHIFFTGSPRVGRIVASAAAKHLSRVTLELGGKSPAIVTPSASIDAAARRIVFGKFFNSGQSCVAPDYALVHASIHDAFVDRVCAYITEFFGSTPQSSPNYGRIINRHHLDRLQQLIDPNKVVIGGHVDSDDRYIDPTVMTNVELDDPVMQEEVFGPILPVLQFHALDDAIAKIRARPHPLALYMFSGSRTEERAILDSVPFGGGGLNATLLHFVDNRLPFGGVGTSGYGYSHGYDGFLTFSHRQGLVRNPRNFDLPLRYPPYTPFKTRIIRALMG